MNYRMDTSRARRSKKVMRPSKGWHFGRLKRGGLPLKKGCGRNVQKKLKKLLTIWLRSIVLAKRVQMPAVTICTVKAAGLTNRQSRLLQMERSSR